MARKATERTGSKPGPAAVDLAAFIKDRGSIRTASEALDVTHPALIAWLEGKSMPSAIHRKKIAIWTSGTIPEESWLTDEEREELAAVEPARDAAPVDVAPDSESHAKPAKEAS